jgi:hypothetical protein
MSMAPAVAHPSQSVSELNSNLDAIRQVLWIHQVTTAASNAAWIAMLPATALLVAAWFAGWLLPSVPALILFSFVFVIATSVQAFRRPTRMHAAKQADRRLSLHERMITALELQGPEHRSSPLVQAQLDDALRHIRGIDAWHAFPLSFPRRHAVRFALLLVLAALAIVVPSPRRDAALRDQAIRRVIASEAARLNKEAVEITKSGQDLTPEQQAAVAALQHLAKMPVQQATSREEALAKLSAAEAALRLQQNGTSASTKQALDQAAATLATDQTTASLAASIASGDAAKTAQDLAKLAQQAATLTPDERDRLAATLRAAGAKAAKADPSVGAALQRAGDAVDNGDTAAQQQAFNQAASTIAQGQRSIQSQSQVDRALAQIQASQRTISQSGDPGQQGSNTQQAQNGQSGMPTQAGTAGAPGATFGQSGAAATAGASGQGQAGQASGQPDAQSGAPGQGNSQNQGQAQGADSAAGQVAGQTAGQSNGQGQGQGQGQVGGNGQGNGASGRIYNPGNNGLHPEQVNGQQSAAGRTETDQATGATNPVQNSSYVPYTDLYPPYKQQATEAMDGSYIPLNMKDLVRDYFSSLDPTK